MTISNPHVVRALARSMIERGRPGITPAPAITAPITTDAAASDPDKGLLPQRDAYIRQSAATVAGRVAPFCKDETP
ncbi:hypothetical protein [Lysobacter sp. CA199]|uniref:hypothetical protein n=1 Tax=Lysobacter sp. CA199 TaxID=3455608 RepID=UPI003F8D6718